MHACVCFHRPVYPSTTRATPDIFVLSSTMFHIPFSLLVVLVLARTSLLVCKNRQYLLCKVWLVVYCNNNIIKETDYILLGVLKGRVLVLTGIGVMVSYQSKFPNYSFPCSCHSREAAFRLHALH